MINPPKIYGPASGGLFISPFNLTVEPMRRLMLINFEQARDPYYLGFEPQVFDDPIHGSGLNVIAYRREGSIDLYHQPGMRLGHKNYDFVGSGLAGVYERPMEGAVFTGGDGKSGVRVQFDFEDCQGRPVSVRVQENSTAPRRPFSLLAPLGSGAKQPSVFPLFVLYSFDFVRRSGTQFDVSIAGKRIQPDGLPLPVGGARVYFTRYSTDPCLLHWNAAHRGPLALYNPGGKGAYEYDGVLYDLSDNRGCLEIIGMRPANLDHDVRFTFNPAFPDIRSLRSGAEVRGEFSIWMEDAGRIGGEYAVKRSGVRVEIEMHPKRGWQPGKISGTAGWMVNLIPVFRRWPKTYRWTASIDLAPDRGAEMQSGWKRI